MSPFTDTNVLLYLLSADSDKAERAETLLSGRVVISVQVLNEFVNVARRKLAMPWSDLTRMLDDIRRFAEVRALTVATHELGLSLAQRYKLSIYDAMIAAAAIEAGCKTLWSEDLQHGQKLAGQLTIRNPFT